MTKPLTCDELLAYLSDYIDNNLTTELTDSARHHLETCENCRVVLNSTQQMIFLYREQGKMQVIPAERQQELYQNLLDIFLESTPKS